jgi:hypothetical protein
MSLKNNLIIGFTLSMYMASCTYFPKSISTPCHFDEQNLTVIGSNSNLKDSIYFKDLAPFSAISYLLTKEQEEFRFNKNHPAFDDRVSIKICRCKNINWAKNKILEELNKRYPFIAVDSMEQYRVFYVSLVDSSKIIATKILEKWEGTDDFEGFGKRGVYVTRSHVRFNTILEDVNRMIIDVKENENTRCRWDERTWQHDFTGYYDFEYRPEFTDFRSGPKKSIAELKQYALDSLGFKFELVSEYSIPIKMIKFLDP